MLNHLKLMSFVYSDGGWEGGGRDLKIFFRGFSKNCERTQKVIFLKLPEKSSNDENLSPVIILGLNMNNKFHF